MSAASGCGTSGMRVFSSINTSSASLIAALSAFASGGRASPM
jgi:hypothetical protein